MSDVIPEKPEGGTRAAFAVTGLGSLLFKKSPHFARVNRSPLRIRKLEDIVMPRAVRKVCVVQFRVRMRLAGKSALASCCRADRRTDVHEGLPYSLSADTLTHCSYAAQRTPKLRAAFAEKRLDAVFNRRPHRNAALHAVF